MGEMGVDALLRPLGVLGKKRGRYRVGPEKKSTPLFLGFHVSFSGGYK